MVGTCRVSREWLPESRRRDLPKHGFAQAIFLTKMGDFVE
jgi:hypothetical protein